MKIVTYKKLQNLGLVSFESYKKCNFLQPSHSCGLFGTAYDLGLAVRTTKSLQLWVDFSAHGRLFRVFFGIPFCRNAVKRITSYEKKR